MAKAGGADMAVFSELCLCGYPPQDLIERPSFAERNQKELGCLAEQVPLPSLVGFVGKAQDNTGKPVANSAALIAGGEILFEQRKMLLPTYDVFDETRYFQPAHTQHVFAMGARNAGHHHLRGLLERQKFLGRAALRTRSRGGAGREGKHAAAEYFVIAVYLRQARLPARDAARDGAPAPAAVRLREPGGRQRQPDFRRVERRFHGAMGGSPRSRNRSKRISSFSTR